MVQNEGTSWIQEDIKIQEKISDDTEVVLEEEESTELVEDQGSGGKGEKEVNTVGAKHNIVIPEVSTAAANLVYIRRSAQKRKDKGKAIMQESEPPKKVKRRVQVHMSMDEELAKKLDEREEVVAEPTQAKKINWNDPVVLRYHAQLNRPYSVAKVCDQIQSFAPMDSEKVKGSEKKGSRKKTLARKRAGEKQSEESMKKQKLEDDIEKEELKAYLDLVPREEFAMEIESLVQPQGEAPSTSPSRITSSPSLSSHPITSSTLNTPPSFQTTHEVEETATMPYDSPLPRDRVVAVEEDLKQTKNTYSIALTKLVLKVKKLEKQVRFGKARRRARIVLSEDEDAAEDPSK
ncbi:hypothetical protein Tco_1284264 [Tanacetum coccineum]